MKAVESKITVNPERKLRRAASLIGLPVRAGSELLGRVAEVVFDPQRLIFGVQLQAESVQPLNGGALFLPIRALDCADSQEVFVADRAEAQPLPPADSDLQRSVYGLSVKVSQSRSAAYVQDILIDVAARRVAAFALSAVPRTHAQQHVRRIEGAEVERLGGELVITPDILREVAASLHMPVTLAS